MRDSILRLGPPIRRAILLGLAAGTPVFFIRTSNEIFGVPKLGFVLFGVSVVAALRGIELLQGAPHTLTRLAIPAGAMALPLLIAWVASPYRYWSLFGWYPRLLGLIPYLVVILYGVLVADAFADETRQLAWAMAIAGSIVGGYGALQMIGADPFMWTGGATGSSIANSTLGNSNFSGTFVAMTFPFFVSLWFEAPEHRRRLIAMFIAAAAGWLVSLSEAAWVAGIVGLAVVIAWIASARWKWARLAGIATAACGAAVLIATVIYRIVYPSVGSITYRGWWWRASWGMFTNSPLVGRGPSSFAIEAVRYRPMEDALTLSYAFPDDPHSVPWAFLTSAGVLGVLGFAAVLVWAIRKGFSIPRAAALPAAFFASVVAYFVNSVTTIDEVSLRVALWTGLGGLAASLVVVGEKAGDAKRARGKTSKRRTRAAHGGRPLRAWPAVAVVAVAGLAGVVWSAGLLLADARVRHARMLFGFDRATEGSQEFAAAISFREEYGYRTIYGLNLGDEAVERGREGTSLIEQMDDVFSFTRHFPYVPSRVDYGLQLYKVGEFDPGAYERAVGVFQQALLLDPFNPMLRVQTADALIAADRSDEAVELLASFTDEAGDRHANVWGTLALAHLESGDVSAAREAMDKALSIDVGESHALEVQETLAKESE